MDGEMKSHIYPKGNVFLISLFRFLVCLFVCRLILLLDGKIEKFIGSIKGMNNIIFSSYIHIFITYCNHLCYSHFVLSLRTAIWKGKHLALVTRRSDRHRTEWTIQLNWTALWWLSSAQRNIFCRAISIQHMLPMLAQWKQPLISCCLMGEVIMSGNG